ncbi:MAG: MlaD family protein, partial [Desulfobulbaceae bacterium]|nr:MlaD family protein [Desulfobulbaceae bacterium]
LVIATGKTRYTFEDYITVHGYLPTAQGVGLDDRVKVAGLDGGYVESIDIDEKNRLVVTMRIFERFHKLLRADSVARLRTVAMFGSTASGISISAGSSDQPLLLDNSFLQVQVASSFDDMAGELSETLKSVKVAIGSIAFLADNLQAAKMGETVKNINGVAVSLRSMSDHVASGGGALGAALYDPKMRKDLKESITLLHTTMTATEARLEQLEPILATTGETSTAAQVTVKALPDLLASLKATTELLNDVLVMINSESQQLPELAGRMNLLILETDRTLRAVQRIWPLSSAMPRPDEEEGKILVSPQPANE